MNNRARLWTLLILILFTALGFTMRWMAANAAEYDRSEQYTILAKSIRDDKVMLFTAAYVQRDYLRKPPVLPHLLALFRSQRNFFRFLAVLSTLLIPMTYWLGRIWKLETTGLVAACLLAVWGPSIELMSTMHPETLFVFFFLSGLLLLRPPESWTKVALYLAAGLVFSTAELTRPVLLPFVVLLGGALFVIGLRRKVGGNKRWIAAVLLAVGFFSPILMYHHRTAQHGFVWVYDRKGVTVLTPLLEDGETFDYIQPLRPDNWHELTDSQREQFVMNLAAKIVQKQPVAVIKKSLVRLSQFWLTGFGRWTAMFPAPHLFLNLFAIIGFAVLFRKNRFAFLISSILFIDFSLMAMVIFTKPRFREVITPWHLLLVGVGITYILEWLREKRNNRHNIT